MWALCTRRLGTWNEIELYIVFSWNNFSSSGLVDMIAAVFHFNSIRLQLCDSENLKSNTIDPLKIPCFLRKQFSRIHLVQH